MSILQDNIELINQKLTVLYGRVHDENSKARFEYLIGDIYYRIEQAERAEPMDV